jgi:putative oxidoreductase
MQSKQALAVARILIAALFLVAGARKLLTYAGTLAYFGKLGIPVPELVLPLTIALELAGGIALVAGWRISWVAPILAAFTLGTALIGHAFWAADPAQFNAQLNNFLKNLAIVGAFIALAMQARTRGD